MTAVALALASAALFGVMTVTIRIALARGGVAVEAATFYTVVPAFLVALVAAAVEGGWRLGDAWAFLAAGVLAPGCSQLLFTFAIRDAGASRASVAVGTGPLVAVAIALAFLGEPIVAGVIVGAGLVVAGGILLVSERDRPQHVKLVGLLFAFGCTVAFATRDNLVRHLAAGTDVKPALAAASTLLTGSAVSAGYLALRRARLRPRPALPYVVPGLAFGLSYVCLFEAYYRGRVTVVSPLVATESLWGVTLSALFLHTELVGRRLAGGAALVVAGAALIGVFR